MKRCTKCKKTKTLLEFSKCKRNKDGLQYRCKTCDANTDKKWYATNHEEKKKKANLWYQQNKGKVKISNLRKYGLTESTYKAMLSDQDSKCAICKTEAAPYLSLCVDHCHKTGKVRGLLCHSCNKAIGLLKDNPTYCANASSYLLATYT